MADDDIDCPAPPLAGRVVRLHFSCRAELPLGSTLRVTGSTLWAPSHLTAQDPTNAHQIATQNATQGPAVGALEDVVDPHVLESSGSESLYASSVELVTSPEEYPIWKTRRPVVVVLHRSSSQQVTQHHYYRYMVITPGAQVMTLEEMLEASRDETPGTSPSEGEFVSGFNGNGVATSDNWEGAVPVMMWEDPFPHLGQTQKKSALSSASLPSVKEKSLPKTLRNLPYRTLDIDVATGNISGLPEGRVADTWNKGDDYTFRSYQIREALNEENRKLNYRLSDLGEGSDFGGDSDQEMTEDIQSDQDVGVGVVNRASSTGSRTPPTAPAKQRIFFVCYHLPVVVVKNTKTGQWEATWNESLLAKTENSDVVRGYDAHWVGTVSTTPPISTQEDKDAVTALLKAMKCLPLFMDQETREAHYYGFCKQVLWPAFHNIDLLDLSTSGWIFDGGKGEAPEAIESDWDQSRLDNWWSAYEAVNQSFADTMSDVLKPNDILWIHDYHLSLLPKLVHDYEMKRYGHTISKKVFFLHIPFPTSQIFRELECGELVLQGMLHADVVGFHAFDHARHFLNAAKRILGLNYESLVGGLIGVHFQGKTVLVTMSNVSIEPHKVDVALALPTVQTSTKMIRQKHNGRMVIAGVDIAQRLSGVSLKLLAFERLLKDYPSWQNKAVMVQRCLLPRSRKADEANTIRELRFLVKRIQDTFGSDVIDYQEIPGSSLPVDERMALWKAADVFMATPIREGLNLLPMEYIYARKEPHPPGVVIASEFSAVCSILNGALRVNPFDIQQSIITIDQALSMEKVEREGRRYRDIDFVSSSPSDTWTRNVLRDLRDATMNRRDNGSESSTSSSTPCGHAARPKQLIDSTSAFLAREAELAFTRLDETECKKAYDRANRRVIISDFNGTIVLKEPPGKYLKREILGSSGYSPPSSVIQALTTLCADPKNTVYVVSGDASETVQKAVGHIPGLGLAASNGGCFSPPPAPSQTERKWLSFDLGVDWDAVKRVALPVLSKYTARSNGSFVKLTHYSIGWSYYSCDPEWGSLQASHLVLELESELRAFDVRFVTLKGIVEIVPRKLNKGLIVKKVLRDASSQRDEAIDFILCMGDDISDEKMFTSVFSYIAEIGDDQHIVPCPPVIGEDTSMQGVSHSKPVEADGPIYSFATAVGKKQTHASYYVNNAEEVADLLVMLSDEQLPRLGTGSWEHQSSENLFS